MFKNRDDDATKRGILFKQVGSDNGDKMNNNLKNYILQIPESGIAVELDNEIKKIYCYDIDENYAQVKRRASLKSLNPDLAQIIESHFKINIHDYGVETLEKIISMPFLGKLSKTFTRTKVVNMPFEPSNNDDYESPKFSNYRLINLKNESLPYHTKRGETYIPDFNNMIIEEYDVFENCIGRVSGLCEEEYDALEEFYGISLRDFNIERLEDVQKTE